MAVVENVIVLGVYLRYNPKAAFGVAAAVAAVAIMVLPGVPRDLVSDVASNESEGATVGVTRAGARAGLSLLGPRLRPLGDVRAIVRKGSG